MRVFGRLSIAYAYHPYASSNANDCKRNEEQQRKFLKALDLVTRHEREQMEQEKQQQPGPSISANTRRHKGGEKQRSLVGNRKNGGNPRSRRKGKTLSETDTAKKIESDGKESHESSPTFSGSTTSQSSNDDGDRETTTRQLNDHKKLFVFSESDATPFQSCSV